jgi:hypothetical protein
MANPSCGQMFFHGKCTTKNAEMEHFAEKVKICAKNNEATVYR